MVKFSAPADLIVRGPKSNRVTDGVTDGVKQMPGYTEDTYEQSIIELFEGMGYEHVYGPEIERDVNSPLYKDFYSNDQLVAMTRELTDTLRKKKTIDWDKRDDARAKMRMIVKRLLKKYKYPPEDMDDALQTVLAQCELWTDNEDVA